MTALIEKLPAAGELSVKSKMLIQIPQHKHEILARASLPDWTATSLLLSCLEAVKILRLRHTTNFFS